MDGVQYAAATDCGLLHVNGTVLAVFETVMRKAGVVDTELEGYGSWQENVYVKLGLRVSDDQRAQWRADAARRAARSLARREDNYKKKRAVGRRKVKEKRNLERKTSSKDHTYKESKEAGEGGKSCSQKGVAGACGCSVQAKCGNGACPCVREKVSCTPLCHGGRPAPKCVRCEVGVVGPQDVQDRCSECESETASICSCMQD